MTIKAFFVTTRTGDCSNHFSAWEHAYGKASRITHTPNGAKNDIAIIKEAKSLKPDVIFYIGAADGPGIPDVQTFHELKGIAPLVNMCSDAVDEGWHATLSKYRSAGCFDLHVSIDGANNSYIDHSTVTPINPEFFGGPSVLRDMRCGFSGSYGSRNVFDYKNQGSAYRGRIVYRLEKLGLLNVRKRSALGKYEDHISFMRRCRIMLNVSLSGSGVDHQIKGRAIEAGWAGCALLESIGSPAINRFPKGSVIPFSTEAEAIDIVRNISDSEIDSSAQMLHAHVRDRYNPKSIYGEILKKVGIDVDTAK